MIRILVMFLMVLCACQPQQLQQSNAGWQKVYQNDENGNGQFGDKQKLLDAVRLGYPVRIGWGTSRIEHVADADFLTIFNGEEVFCQIKPISGQAPSIEGDSLKIRFRRNKNWTKIAGTNGYTSGMMSDQFDETFAGGGADRFGATTWYVDYPNHNLEIEARPLWRSDAPIWENYNEKK